MRFLFIAIFMLASNNAFSISQEYIEESIKRAAKDAGVPVDLLRAICFAESRLKPDAYVFSDGGNNNHAFGMCQVLYRTAGDFGFKDSRCLEDFRFRKQHRNYQHCKLFGPYTNALYAAYFLKRQLDRYDQSWINAIAAYNSGSVRICSSGWVYANRVDEDGNVFRTKLYECKKGGILNQRYVDRVLHFLNKHNKNR